MAKHNVDSGYVIGLLWNKLNEPITLLCLSRLCTSARIEELYEVVYEVPLWLIPKTLQMPLAVRNFSEGLLTT